MTMYQEYGKIFTWSLLKVFQKSDKKLNQRVECQKDMSKSNSGFPMGIKPGHDEMP